MFLCSPITKTSVGLWAAWGDTAPFVSIVMWWKKYEVSEASESPKWDRLQIRSHLHEKHVRERIDYECSEILSACGWIKDAGARISSCPSPLAAPSSDNILIICDLTLSAALAVGFMALLTGQHYITGNPTGWGCLINSYQFHLQEHSPGITFAKPNYDTLTQLQLTFFFCFLPKK